MVCERDRREVEAWERLDFVNDPELDEPVTDMGFIEALGVADDGDVEVAFRLPTYWCSPNFAFLMADDIHRELSALPWTREVRVTLHDHMFADRLNAAVADGRGFEEIFDDLSTGEDMDGLRAKFARKAFDRRQEALLLGLRVAGWSAEAIVAMTVDELAEADFTPLSRTDASNEIAAEARRQRPRYLMLARRQGLVSGAEDPAFVQFDGAPIPAQELDDHLGRLRAVRVNMEFSGALCRGLKASRYKERPSVKGDLTLVDFIPGSVPAAEMDKHDRRA
ncbi:iron-sulfur cluster assembly protein [Amorphus sp. 3PC139-8]|uniref:iron-sulfur cluster assembly protein n=1 Tax=Amorphus sp. 3PC139-8 TaxID=2735676 RepID=UPI00345DBD42